VTVWGNVDNLGFYALVFRIGIGIAGDDVCNSPDRGVFPGVHGIADGLEPVGRALHVWICQARSTRERRGGRDEPVIEASPASVVRSCADAVGTRIAASMRAGSEEGYIFGWGISRGRGFLRQ